MGPAAAALALLVSAGLTGCESSAEPAPPQSAPTSPATSPSPSPTVAVPVMPEEAKGTSEASAKAFVRHWIDVLNYAAATGETTELRTLSADTCESCQAIEDNIHTAYANGGEIRGKGWTLKGIRAIQATRRVAVLSLDIILEPEVLVSGDGTETENPGSRQPMTMHLEAAGHGWTVKRLDLVS